jgi:hypothetical protein
MISKHPRQRQLRKWLRRLALTLVIAYGGYLLPINLLLNTPLADRLINRQPERVHTQWARAWSWWPGRLTAWAVSMQGATNRRRWQVAAARVQARVLLRPLWQREVRVPELRAEQLTASSERIALAQRGSKSNVLPAAPAPAPAPAFAPAASPGHPAWTLRFERIFSDSFDGARIDDLQLQGRGTLALGLVKRLRGGDFELLPSTLDIDAARLRWKDEELLRDARLHASTKIAAYRTGQVRGIEVLRLADIRLQLSGASAALALRHDDRGRVQVNAVAGHGQADVDLHWARGQLAAGSRAMWQAPLTGSDITGKPLQGALQLALQADQDLHLRLQLPAQPDGTLQADVDLRLRGRELPLADWRALLPRSSGHLAMHWRFDSLGWITRLFPQAGWLSLQGDGLVDADVQLRDGQPAAGSRVRLPEVTAVAQVMGNRIDGRAEADLRLLVDAQGRATPQLSLHMRRFAVAAVDTPQRPFVQGNDLRLQLQSAPLGASVKELRDSTRAQLSFHNAQVPDLRAYNRYLPQRQLRFAGGAGRLSGDFSVESAGSVGRGWLRAEAAGARLRMVDLSLRGDVGIDIRLRRADLHGERFVIDGSSVNLRNVSFSEPGGKASSGWWARVRLQRAQMTWSRPISVDGSAAMETRDVGFLLSLFSRQRDYPKWIYRVVDAGQAQLSGRVHWHDELLVLDRLQARNERFQLAGRLRLRGEHRDGSLYARWGVLDAALQLNGEQRNWHLLHSRQWYDAQPDLLR